MSVKASNIRCPHCGAGLDIGALQLASLHRQGIMPSTLEPAVEGTPMPWGGSLPVAYPGEPPDDGFGGGPKSGPGVR